MKLWQSISTHYGQLRGYGRRDIRRRVDAAERMTPSELAAISDEAFRRRVIDALDRFPAYARLVRKRAGTLPGSPGEVHAETLPVLSKSDIQGILSDPDSYRPAYVIPLATGGSTGKPFHYFVTRNSFEWGTVVSERGYSWARAEEGRRSFYIWGTAITPPSRAQRLKSEIHHRLQNRRFFNSFHFGKDEKIECCRQINSFRPESIVGYAGNIVEFAQFVRDNAGYLDWRAKTAITAAEAPRPGSKEIIEAHVADELFLSYGSREFMLIGMECGEHTGYHVSSDNLFVEIVDDAGLPLPPGETGRIVITDLYNDATPFVRYEIGDLGRMGDGCPCGLPFPVLEAVDGRIQETIVRRDGEKLTTLFIPHLMKEFGWIDGYQIRQSAQGEITVTLVTSDDGWKERTTAIESHLREKLGDDMTIGFERVDSLTKTALGKTLIVISDL